MCKFGFSQQRHALIQPSLRTLALPLLALEVAPLFLRERRLLGSGGGSGGSSSERPRRRHDAPPSPEEQLQLRSTGDTRLDPRRALRTPLAVRPEVLDRRPLHLPHMPRREHNESADYPRERLTASLTVRPGVAGSFSRCRTNESCSARLTLLVSYRRPRSPAKRFPAYESS